MPVEYLSAPRLAAFTVSVRLASFTVSVGLTPFTVSVCIRAACCLPRPVACGTSTISTYIYWLSYAHHFKDTCSDKQHYLRYGHTLGSVRACLRTCARTCVCTSPFYLFGLRLSTILAYIGPMSNNFNLYKRNIFALQVWK